MGKNITIAVLAVSTVVLLLTTMGLSSRVDELESYSDYVYEKLGRVDDCNERVFNQYQDNWNNQCRNLALGDNCILSAYFRADIERGYIDDLVSCSNIR